MTNETHRESTLPSHSVTERHFYLMVLPCERCGKGPFKRVSSERTGDEKVDIWYTRCRACGAGRRLLFDRSKLQVEEASGEPAQIPVVNPTNEASELLDLGQWLALFHAIISATAEETDRKEAQRLGYEATLCLEEALKFYPSDGELPDEKAFFTEHSRRGFRERPEQFARERLYQMRQKLPSLRVIRAHLDRGPSGEGDAVTSRPTRWARFRRWLRRRL